MQVLILKILDHVGLSSGVVSGRVYKQKPRCATGSRMTCFVIALKEAVFVVVAVYLFGDRITRG